MPSVVLVDPLWWVAARLRRILTGLMVLALALGPAAEARRAVGAPLAGTTRSTTVPLAESSAFATPPVTEPVPSMFAAFSSSASVGSPSTARSDLAPEFDTQPGPGRVSPDLSLPDLAPTWATSSQDERSKPARHAPSLGQRAPPAS